MHAGVWGGGAQDHVRDGDDARGFGEIPKVGVIAAQYGKNTDHGGVSAGHACVWDREASRCHCCYCLSQMQSSWYYVRLPSRDVCSLEKQEAWETDAWWVQITKAEQIGKANTSKEPTQRF